MVYLLKTGDLIRLRQAGTHGDWCPAIVMLASPCGRSVVLELHGALHASSGGLYAGGSMAISVDYETETVVDLD